MHSYREFNSRSCAENPFQFFLMKMSAREVELKGQKLISKLEKSGQLNPNLKECIELSQTLEDVETLAAPFKASSTTQTLANKAKSIPGKVSLYS